MRKSVLLLFAAVMLLLAPVAVIAAETESAPHETENADYVEIFSKITSPVLLKYIALENNCAVISDAESKKATVTDKNGAVLKKYEGLFFVNDEPVADAGIIQHDLGWVSCRHVPNTDMFHNEADAITAGGFTYYNSADTFYVGRCYEGHYFSASPGEHAKKCSHTMNLDMLYEIPVEIEKGSDAPMPAPHTPEDIFARGMKPVFLRYVLQKNGYTLSYSKADDKISVFKDGALITSIKGTASLGGEFVTDAGTLERILGPSSYSHEPDTDLFDKEETAITAAWFTYYPNSGGGRVEFYVGNCYGGYYFSQEAGKHAAVCEHNYNSDMFFEKLVAIENGKILYDEAEETAVLNDDIAAYKQDKNQAAAESPADSLTKMVTVSHTEYAKEEGVQSLYFSYRDRAYRNFWEDLANYDVTDYIFIPPDFPATDTVKDFSRDATDKMASAIGKLLEQREDAKLWIGSPGITSENYTQPYITAEAITSFLNEAKARIGNAVWLQNVEGVYINQEAIYPEEKRAQIERIKDVVNTFKSSNLKKALWIPYYDLAEDKTDIAESIAEVSRIPGLFDYIIIQPGYFFFDTKDGEPAPETTAHRSQNIDAVMSSAMNNFVSNAQGEPVDGKTSNAAIGLEMEPQASYFSSSRDTRDESLDRYAKYLLAGAELKETSPIAFYASGDPHCNKEVLVYKFYGAEELLAGSVRKKLDSALDNFYSYVFATREKDEVFYEYTKKLYLRENPMNTEESFLSVYNANLILPEFYLYEKTNELSGGTLDLAEHIKEFGEVSDMFDTRILWLLGSGV